MGRLIQGRGINDMRGLCKKNGKSEPWYQAWVGMLQRCYCEKHHIRRPTYIGCSVCDEWLTLSKFKLWYDENYVDGFQLDKDLLVEGNKIYGPDSCMYVSRELNNLFLEGRPTKQELPTGVHYCFERNKYVAKATQFAKSVNLGRYDTPEEAHEVYKESKRLYVLDVIEKQRGIDSDRILDTLFERYKENES